MKIAVIQIEACLPPRGSEFFSEIGLEHLDKFIAPIATDRLKPAEEEPHHGRLLHEAEPSDEVLVPVELRHAIRYVFDLPEGESATRDGDAHKLHPGGDFLPIPVPIFGHRPALDAPRS